MLFVCRKFTKDTPMIFKLQPESLINILRIYVFKFVTFIEIYSISQSIQLEKVPRQFFCHYELYILRFLRFMRDIWCVR